MTEMRKAAPVRELPPRLELDCLKALWKLGEGNVKQVRDLLAAERELAYTTVMTVLDRLSRRGGVRRRKVGRSFVYVPVLTQDCVRKLAVSELLACYFNGSADQLREYLERFPDEPLVMAAAATDGELQLDASLL
jgi:predicted transcriptional regulator